MFLYHDFNIVRYEFNLGEFSDQIVSLFVVFSIYRSRNETCVPRPPQESDYKTEKNTTKTEQELKFQSKRSKFFVLWSDSVGVRGHNISFLIDRKEKTTKTEKHILWISVSSVLFIWFYRFDKPKKTYLKNIKPTPKSEFWFLLSRLGFRFDRN